MPPPRRGEGKNVRQAPASSAPPLMSNPAETEVKDMFAKPLTVAAVGVLASKAVLPPVGFFDIRGIRVPWDAALFGGLFVGSVLSEVLHKYAFSHIPNADKLSEPVSLAVAGGGNALVTAGTLRLMNDNVFKLGPMKLMALGLFAELIGDGIYSRLVRPMLLQ